MKKSFSKLFVAPMTVLIVASFAATPVAAAKRDFGGGGGGGGKREINNRNSDVRANQVRSTSVNNVNVRKNTNVNVNVNNNRGGGWDNDYHPVATAVAVTAAVAVTSAVIGSMVRTVPPGCVPVNYRGMIYQQCGNTWYQPQGTQYVVIAAPY
jgi:hypothetical protein